MSGSCDTLASRSAKQLLTHSHDETAQGIKVFPTQVPPLGPESSPPPLILPFLSLKDHNYGNENHLVGTFSRPTLSWLFAHLFFHSTNLLESYCVPGSILVLGIL